MHGSGNTHSLNKYFVTYFNVLQSDFIRAVYVLCQCCWKTLSCVDRKENSQFLFLLSTCRSNTNQPTWLFPPFLFFQMRLSPWPGHIKVLHVRVWTPEAFNQRFSACLESVIFLKGGKKCCKQFPDSPSNRKKKKRRQNCCSRPVLFNGSEVNLLEDLDLQSTAFIHIESRDFKISSHISKCFWKQPLHPDKACL